MTAPKFIVVHFLLVCAAVLPATVSAQTAKARQIDNYIQVFAKAKQFSGVILAAQDGKVFFERAYGLANADFNIPNQLNTRIGIASITKYLTVVIAARLLEDGKISREDKLNKYISDFPNGNKITIDMLLEHRSGIPHRVTKPDEEAIPRSSAEMVEKIKQAKLEFEPGTKRLYSSAGFSVLARVMEIASGRSYSQLLKEYVFEPAQMNDSVNFDSESIIERKSQDYILSPTGYINAPNKDYSFLVGAGSVYSTARDIFKFGEAVMGGKYGKAARTILVDGESISGNGSTNGHRAFVKIDGAKKWGYVLVSNLNSGANDLVIRNLENILEGKPVATPEIPNPKIIPNPNKNLSDYVGAYRSNDGGTAFDVFVKNDSILVGDLRLYSIKTDCFFEYRYYGDLCFTRDEAGKATGIEWAAPGFKFHWAKQ